MGSTRGARVRQAMIAATIGGLLAVAGCAAAEREAIPSASAPPSPVPSATPSEQAPRESAPPAAEGELEGVAISVPCGQLLDPQTVYDHNPNLGVDPRYAPTETASAALEWGGVACGLLNQTSGVQYSFAVARFTPETAGPAQSELAAGAAVASGVPGEAYFRSAGGTGRIDVFIDDYWVAAESVAFFEAADAAGLLGGIVEALP